MNINDSSSIRECTSCQMCGAICPTGAVSIKLNEKGFYRPYIDDEKCIDCSLCAQNCYKFDDNIKLSLNPEKYVLYAAWANDSQILEQTTSGGIADIMAKWLVENGYRCIGVEYNCESNRAKHIIADSVEEVKSFRGSKYIQSLSVDAFKVLVNSFKTDKYAVFGLPCQIYAIDKFLQIRGKREQNLLIDLYCHGCPSLNIWQKYIEELRIKSHADKIISVNFRSKIRGWGNYTMVVTVEKNGKKKKVVSPVIKDKFFELFFSDFILNDTCGSCELRSTLEYTDIRLGDFWGHTFVNNRIGVSGVSLVTKHGQNVFDAISNQLTIESQEAINFLPYQSFYKKYSIDSEKRDILLKMLSDPSKQLDVICRKYVSMLSLKCKIKRILKNAVYLTPISCQRYFKSLIYSVKRR